MRQLTTVPKICVKIDIIVLDNTVKTEVELRHRMKRLSTVVTFEHALRLGNIRENIPPLYNAEQIFIVYRYIGISG